MQRTPNHRKSQQGAMVVLVALILLSIITVAAMGLARSSLRETMITGNESTGRKASEMADSGLDWTITWGSPYATVTTGSASKALQDNMAGLLNAIDNTDSTNRPANYLDDSQSLRVLMNGATVGGDMTPSTSSWKQNSLQQSVVVPSFDVEVRYLGASELENTGRSALIKSHRSLWLVRSTGRATIGTTGQSFISRREAVVEYIN